ncbi:MAG: cyclic nucleotide-binding domain-containing protein [Spirochaetota bacterium]|jgi:CRP-like cAMP-binding protein|nr:cyclic nucleotide-binding domain-containing protein [Spirochaetota bacterium]
MHKVYDAEDAAVYALLLNQGELVFSLSEKQNFSLKGANIIFGAAEVLHGLEGNTMNTRMISVYSGSDSTITKIPNANLKKFITLYNIGFNITRVVARTVQKSNQLIAYYNENFLNENHHPKKHYIKYYNTILALEKDAENRQIKRLEAFANLKKQTIAYRKGSLFAAKPKSIQHELEGKRIDEYKAEFPPGSVICKQNAPASDLFILNKGRVRVLLGEEEVARIDKPGTIFGEMSLFLNEPRSATLIADANTLVTIINRESLPVISGRIPDFFLRITTTLWVRFKTNIEMIQELENLKPESALFDLQTLQREIGDFMKSERIYWLKTYVDELQNAF